MIPSISPSETGMVVTITLTKQGEVLSETDISQFVEDIADEYGVASDDVNVETSYSVSGRMQLAESASEEDVISIIAEALGVHPKDVEVSINEEGEVTFIVASDNSDSLEALQNVMSSPTFVERISELLEIASIEIVEEISMALDITVDANDATNDVMEMNELIKDRFEEQGFDVIVHGIYWPLKFSCSESCV